MDKDYHIADTEKEHSVRDSVRPKDYNLASLKKLADEALIDAGRRPSLATGSNTEIPNSQRNPRAARITPSSGAPSAPSALKSDDQRSRKDVRKAVAFATEKNQVKFIEDRREDIYGFIEDAELDEELYYEEEEPETVEALAADVANRSDEMEDLYLRIFKDSMESDKGHCDGDFFGLRVLEERLSDLIIEQVVLKHNYQRVSALSLFPASLNAAAVVEDKVKGLWLPSVEAPLMLHELLCLHRDASLLLREAKMKRYYKTVKDELTFWRAEFADLADSVDQVLPPE